MQKVKVEVDRAVGKFFVNWLEDAQRKLWLVTPWISHEYAKLALRKREEGVDVKVITTNNFTSEHRKGLQELLAAKEEVVRKEKLWLKIFGVLLMLGGVLLAFLFFLLGLLMLVGGFVAYLRGRAKKKTRIVSKLGEGKLKIYEFSPFYPLHAKVYVADEKVVVGSANLTTTGMKRGVEGVVLIEDAQVANKVLNKISTIEKLVLKEMNLEEVGKALKIV